MPGMLRDHLQRALAPRVVVAASRLQAPRRAAARLRRWFGRPLRMELYFAFDDPYAAIALPGLLRLCERRPVALTLYPLLQHGIPGDPAAPARALHAVQDAARLALRTQQRLARRAPLAPADTAFLAAWCEAARGDAAMPRFAAAALEQLWLGSTGPLQREVFVALYREHLRRDPPAETAADAAALASNARRLLAKGHWESPALRLAGEWFFAHERLAQIARRLDELGARAA